MRAVYAGSFDPFTNGHLEVVTQASRLFDGVIVLIADNPDKRHWLAPEKRAAIVAASAGEGVETDILPPGRTTADYAYRRGACLVRGLGEFTDYAGEKTLLGVNSRLRPEVETVFLMTKGTHNQVRSSSVKATAKYAFGWRCIRDALPRPSYNAALMKIVEAWDERLGRLWNAIDLSRYLRRPYHNLEHLVFMLDKYREWAAAAGDGKQRTAPDERALYAAIAYHDLFVDSDSDVPPGEDIAMSLRAIDMSPPEMSEISRESVESLVLATDHAECTFSGRRDLSPAQKLLRDLDLAILGESASEYDRYAAAIREEYAGPGGYPIQTFNAGRTAFLNGMLARLASGPLIDAGTDQRIRENLRRELAGMEAEERKRR